jgi:hypothetical protein
MNLFGGCNHLYLGAELKREYLASACALDLPKGWCLEKNNVVFTQTCSGLPIYSFSIFPSKTNIVDEKPLQAITCVRS